MNSQGFSFAWCPRRLPLEVTRNIFSFCGQRPARVEPGTWWHMNPMSELRDMFYVMTAFQAHMERGFTLAHVLRVSRFIGRQIPQAHSQVCLCDQCFLTVVNAANIQNLCRCGNQWCHCFTRINGVPAIDEGEFPTQILEEDELFAAHRLTEDARWSFLRQSPMQLHMTERYRCLVDELPVRYRSSSVNSIFALDSFLGALEELSDIQSNYGIPFEFSDWNIRPTLTFQSATARNRYALDDTEEFTYWIQRPPVQMTTDGMLTR